MALCFAFASQGKRNLISYYFISLFTLIKTISFKKNTIYTSRCINKQVWLTKTNSFQVLNGFKNRSLYY